MPDDTKDRLLTALGQNRVDDIVDSLDEVYGDWQVILKDSTHPPIFHIKWFILNLVEALKDNTIDFNPESRKNREILNKIYGDLPRI